MPHLKPNSLRVIMRAAARIIEESAESMRETCEGGTPTRDWSCDPCPANGECQRRFKREIATATLLRDAARNRKLRTE